MGTPSHVVTRDAVVTSSVLETHSIQAGRYVRTSETVDPSSAANDELETQYSYYDDGRVRSVSKSDGSWSFHTYSGESTTTYGPWLSESNLVFANNAWSLPTSGLAVKTVTSSSSTSPSSSSSIVDMTYETGLLVATLSSSSTTTDTSIRDTSGTKRFDERGDLVTLHSYTPSHADNATDPSPPDAR